MAVSDFNSAFEIVVGIEGGYVNDPADPGGETKYGISKRFHPDLDIKNLTLEEAKDIYHSEYWLPSGAADLQQPMDLFVFDTAVNQGVSVAKHIYSKYQDPMQYLGYRAYIYGSGNASNFKQYGRGWMNRLFKLALGVHS